MLSLFRSGSVFINVAACDVNSQKIAMKGEESREQSLPERSRDVEAVLLLTLMLTQYVPGEL